MRFRVADARSAMLVAALGATLPSVCLHADESGAGSEKVTIPGVLEAVTVHEVAVEAEHLGPFKVERVLTHGTKVTAGQNLVWFESEAVDKKIAEAEVALKLARLGLEAEEFAHQHALKVEEIDRRKAERARKEAKQAYDNFVTVDRERQLKAAEFDRTSARASLENAAEELQQLEQMYKEDDLTEESEEIVLKRAKQAVEAAEFRLEGVEVATERAVTQGLAKTEADQEDALALAELAFEKAIRELDAKRTQREIELGKKRDAFHEEEKKLAEMGEERKKLVLTSPVDGIALHGPLMRGRLGDKPSGLKEGAAVAADQVVMTVVDPERLQIRLDLEEKQLSVVEPGDTCTIEVDAFPGFQASGKVASVSLVPYAATRYDCVVTIESLDRDPGLKPLMTCQLEFEKPPVETSAEEPTEEAKPEGTPEAESKEEAASAES